MRKVLITLADIRAAADRIRGRVLRTPLKPSSWLSTVTGGEVLLKLETLQPTGSYKIRGAFNAALRLSEQTRTRQRQLVTASAGNHGRALAVAAQSIGLPLVVYVPEHAPRTKLDAIRATGAQLRTCRDYDEAERSAKAHAKAGEAIFISPYAQPDVIAGAGTVGLEILEERPDVEVIVVAIGGGGLIGGIAVAAHGLAPAVTVVGAEVAASAPFTRSLAAGHIVPIDVAPTLADGLAGNLDPDTPTFEMVRTLVARIVLVQESALRAAIAGIAAHERLVVEGAGATAVAAVLDGGLDLRRRRAAIVLSGANIDMDVFKGII